MPPGRPCPRRRRAVDDRRERGDELALAEPHHDHALGRAAEPLDVLDRHLDHGAAGGDQHHLVAVADDARADEVAAGLGELDRLHAHAAAALARVLGDAGALAVAVLGHDEQVGVVLGDLGRDHLVLAAQRHAAHALGARGPSARASLSEKRIAWPLRETSRMSSSAWTCRTADELVALAHLDRDDPVRLQRRVVLGELRLLDDAVLRRAEQVLGLLEVPRLDHGAHLLALAERQQVDDRAALRLARAERKLVHLEPVDLADRGEEEDVVVRRGDEEVLDVVVVLEVHPHHADAAAALLAVRSSPAAA